MLKELLKILHKTTKEKLSLIILILCVYFVSFTQECYAAFPCDLASIKEENGGTLPKLTLSLENHADYYCNVDLSVHQELSKSSKIIVAQEGMDYPKTLGEYGIYGYENVIGIEEPHLKILGDLLLKAQPVAAMVELGIVFKTLENRWDRVWTTDTKYRLIKFFKVVKDSPAARKVWKELVVPTQLQSQKEILDKMIEGSESEDGLLDKSSAEYVEFFELAHQLLQDLGEKINKGVGGDTKIKSGLSEKIIPDLTLKQVADSSFPWSVLINKRNHVMAENISKLYCQAAKENRPLIAVVGAMHLSGINDIIKSSSKGLIQIEYRNPVQSCRELFDASDKEIEKEMTKFLSPYCGTLNAPSNEILHSLSPTVEGVAKRIFYAPSIAEGWEIKGKPKTVPKLHMTCSSRVKRKLSRMLDECYSWGSYFGG